MPDSTIEWIVLCNVLTYHNSNTWIRAFVVDFERALDLVHLHWRINQSIRIESIVNKLRGHQFDPFNLTYIFFSKPWVITCFETERWIITNNILATEICCVFSYGSNLKIGLIKKKVTQITIMAMKPKKVFTKKYPRIKYSVYFGCCFLINSIPRAVLDW